MGLSSFLAGLFQKKAEPSADDTIIREAQAEWDKKYPRHDPNPTQVPGIDLPYPPRPRSIEGVARMRKMEAKSPEENRLRTLSVPQRRR